MKIAVYDSLEALPPAASARFSFAHTGNFFLSAEWFRCLHQTVTGASHEARIYLASTDSDTPVGLGVYCRARSSSDLRGLTTFYTGEYRPVVAFDESADALLPEMLAYVTAERPRWCSLEFDYLRTDRSDADDLCRLLGASGFWVERGHRYENWYLPLGDMDFDAFYRARPSQMRNTIARREKKLLKAHSVDVELFTSPSDDLDRAIRDYLHVYGSSWKAQEPYPTFIPTLVRTCAELGILRLGILRVDSTPAAAQLWITQTGKALIYKLAYDEKFAEFSVGSILSREMFKAAIDGDKVREIDYGVGSEGYKRDWMSDVRRFEKVTALNPRHPRGLVSVGAAICKRVAKPLLRPLRSRAAS